MCHYLFPLISIFLGQIIVYVYILANVRIFVRQKKKKNRYEKKSERKNVKRRENENIRAKKSQRNINIERKSTVLS